MKIPDWQLHRGYWLGGCRENSMEAFRAAAKQGCSMIEFDVQLSKEKVPHAFHDTTLKRIFAIDEKFAHQSNHRLQKLNVPTLKSVLVADDLPIFLNVELKTTGLCCLGLARAVGQDLTSHGANKRVLISSFNSVCLWWSRWFSPKIPRALVVQDVEIVRGWRLKLAQFLAKAEYINVHASLFEDQEIRQILLGSGMKVAVWTVNNDEQARRLLTLGATSIISDSLLSRT